ncbi:hypothetical protein Taro_055263 [Colocasia esculenta]|uniref:ACT domain-containing protein n=1 Tax=Colocasia esculenta TaxID=4460 RepID=A0A843XQV0_COLES|nr:hypothetical protein [Colocasia esculenta]
MGTGSFVVKVGWRRGETGGGAGHVQRVLESLALSTTSVTVQQTDTAGEMLTTAFVEVEREQGSMTDEDLRKLVVDTAMRMNLLS